MSLQAGLACHSHVANQDTTIAHSGGTDRSKDIRGICRAWATKASSTFRGN